MGIKSVLKSFFSPSVENVTVNEKTEELITEYKHPLYPSQVEKAISESMNYFYSLVDKKNVSTNEITPEIYKKIIENFLGYSNFTDALNYSYNAIGEFVKNTSDEIDYNLPFEELKKTDAYIQKQRYDTISFSFHDSLRPLIINLWIYIYGKKHTDEEAAEIAANKWCELIFNFHLQDNGALNEKHSFQASLLSTYLGDNRKKEITEEQKEKFHELCKQYYLHYIQFMNNAHNRYKHIEWLNENLKDEKNDPINYFYDMSCDYNPNIILLLCLINSGIDRNKAFCICPWKTTISIRKEDNTVMYRTYQNCEEL